MFEDRYIQVGDLNIRYRQVGEGADLLLVHGLGATLEYWDKVVPGLAKHFRVTALDMPGFGLSSKPDVEYGLPFYSRFLHNFCEVMSFHSIYLCGHSLGGALSLQFAMDNVDKIKKLQLIDCAGFSTQVTWIFRLMSIPFFCNLLIYKNEMMYEQALRLSLYRKESLSKDFVKSMYKMAGNDGHRNTVCYLLNHHASLMGMKKSSLDPLWKNMSVLNETPVSVIWGDKDPLLNISHLKAVKKRLPTAETHVIEECGHVPMIEAPDACLKLMLDFLLDQ